MRSVVWGVAICFVTATASALSPNTCREGTAQIETGRNPNHDRSSFASMFIALGKKLLGIRYDIEKHGYENIPQRLPGQKGGTLFIFNHPSYDDPFVQYTQLWDDFKARPIMGGVHRPGGIGGALLGKFNPFFVPEGTGPEAAAAMEGTYADVQAAINRGENIGVHWSGRLQRGPKDEMYGKSFVDELTKRNPDMRVVFVRMEGMWGSSLSPAPTGDFPNVGKTLLARAVDVAKNWMAGKAVPKRKIDLYYKEGSDFPKTGTPDQKTAYADGFLNANAKPNTYVRYRWWEPEHSIVLPEPIEGKARVPGKIEEVPDETKQQVIAYFKAKTGADHVDEKTELAAHLGLDSIEIQEINTMLKEEFGVSNPVALKSVGDVMLVAHGAKAEMAAKIRPPDIQWEKDVRYATGKKVEYPEHVQTQMEAFIRQLRQNPDKIFIGDSTSGYLTYRQFATAVHLFKKRIEAYPPEEKYVGIMAPKSVGGRIAYYAALAAGRIPKEINFTSGEKNVQHAVDTLGIKHILTPRQLIESLGSKKVTFPPGVADKFVFLEDVKKTISTAEGLKAMALMKLPWFLRGNSLWGNSTPESTAVVLATSGSEKAPKMVPLSNKNLIANAKAMSKVLEFDDRTRFLNMLPDFHSFGVALSNLSEALGVPQFLSPDPTDGLAIAKQVHYNKITHIAGTPKFLSYIAHAAKPGELDSLKVIVSGADKLTPEMVALLKAKAPNAIVLQGYGITETSPVVAVVRPDHIRHDALGPLLPGIEGMIVDDKQLAEFTKGTPGATLTDLGKHKEGILLVSGDNVFDGYINYAEAQPFVNHNGKKWYITGDVIKKDTDDNLIFVGRKKRFVKKGGEMISLPAMEEPLQTAFPEDPAKPGPTIAIQNTAAEAEPDLVLFTTKRDLTMAQANEELKKAGLSRQATVQKVVYVDAMPMLGSGKVNYPALAEMLK